MESEGIAFVDSWQTYVIQITDACLALLNYCSFLKRAQGRAHFCMSYLYGLVSSHSYCPLDPQSFRKLKASTQPDWPRWPTITLIFGTSRNKTVMAFSPPSFRSSLPNPTPVIMSSPSYIRLIIAALESPVLAPSKTVCRTC